MKVLELFSGTHSVGKVCEELGWNVISVDLELEATHKVDIMDFDYKQYPKDYFNIVWGSPPCTAFSILQTSWLGRHKRVNGELTLFTQEQMELDMKEADKIVLKTLEIIKYFDCDYWFMENPKTGRLKSRDYMEGIPYYDVDYCKYSDWGYKKPTRIWTNKKDWNNLICKKDCDNMLTQTLHKSNLGNGNMSKAQKHQKDVSISHSRLEKYRVPPKLILSLFLD